MNEEKLSNEIISSKIDKLEESLTKTLSFIDISLKEYRNTMSEDQLNADNRKATNERELNFLAGFSILSEAVQGLKEVLINLNDRLKKSEGNNSGGSNSGSSDSSNS